MSILQALKGAKGLGSAHNGTHHFIVQRATAVILVPLVAYFFYSIAVLAHARDYAQVLVWFGNPLRSGLLLAFMVTGFYHAAVGVQVVIEDYVHDELLKWVSLIALRGACLIGASVAVLSIIKLSIFGFPV